jgi:hypothetical protein
MKPAPRRSTRVQNRNTNVATSPKTRRSTRTSTKRKSPPVYTSSSDDEKTERKKPSTRQKEHLPTKPSNLRNNSKNDPEPGETTPSNVNQPVSTLVHPNLTSAWTINKAMPMCFIFDTVLPARQFKRGLVFSEDPDAPFPRHNEVDPGEITETDMDESSGPGLTPIMHEQGR